MSKSNRSPVSSNQATGFDLESVANLCSVGAVPIPDDLPDDQQRELVVAISKRRRKRLLHLFAAVIADDIWRERQTSGD